MTPPIWMTKPKLTSKLLPAWSSTSKLVPAKTQSDAEDHQRIKLMSGGDTRRPAGTDAAPINHFVQWFQAISVNMNGEAQRRALVASRKAASSEFTDVEDDEESSIAAESAPVQSDLRRVEYSAEMAEIGFPSQSGGQMDSPKE